VTSKNPHILDIFLDVAEGCGAYIFILSAVLHCSSFTSVLSHIRQTDMR